MGNLKACQNLILRVILKKEPMFPTDNLYKELDVLPVKIKCPLKLIAIFLKKNNLFKPVSLDINTRYANENFLIKYPKKTTAGKYFEILGTKQFTIFFLI